MQPQVIMENYKLLLDFLRAGAVLPSTEVQQHVNLSET